MTDGSIKRNHMFGFELHSLNAIEKCYNSGIYIHVVLIKKLRIIAVTQFEQLGVYYSTSTLSSVLGHCELLSSTALGFP